MNQMGDAELTLHSSAPTNAANKPRPAIGFFFVGGWTVGTPIPFYPVRTAGLFKSRREAAGGRCEWKLVPGAGHPLYDCRKGGSPLRNEVLGAVEAFLASLGHGPDVPAGVAT